MKIQLAQEIEKLLNDHSSSDVVFKFKQKLQEGKLIRDEDLENHFCVYFAAYDYKFKQIFIGNHIKSGLWLFNGGHVDKGENLRETVMREIDEEWGLDINDLKVGFPAMLTLTEINNPTKQTCRLHFDVWHFVDVDKNSFNPNPQKLAEEFYSAEWMDLAKARKIITDKSMLRALDFIESNYF
ncbi:MAG: NUDIX domain-containing protein [Patescibacteria group bacterium]